MYSHRSRASLLAVGVAIMVVTSLSNAWIATQFDAPPLPKVIAWFIFGASLGALLQGGLLLAVDARFRASVGAVGHRLPMEAVLICGLLDVAGITGYLTALTTGDKAVVITLVALSPVLVAVWEMYRGLLQPGRVLPGLIVLTVGLWLVGSPTATGVASTSSICVAMIVMRTICTAATESWERGIEGENAVRFGVARFAVMAVAGIPIALMLLVTQDLSDEVIHVWERLPLAVVGLQVGGQTLAFTAQVCRIQVKRLDGSATAPAAIFAIGPAVASLLIPTMNTFYPDFFGNESLSFSIVAGVVLVTAGACFIAVNRSRPRSPPSSVSRITIDGLENSP